MEGWKWKEITCRLLFMRVLYQGWRELRLVGDDMNNYCVYEHIFPNGKRYIGISNNAEKRWRNGKGYKEQTKMAKAINHYGWDNIVHRIIVDGLSLEQAQRLEREFVDAYDSIEEDEYRDIVNKIQKAGSYMFETIFEWIIKKYGEEA